MVADEFQQLSLNEQDAQGIVSVKGSKPTFFPPLWLARRTAVLQTLRKEGVRSVAELGCGTGAVLAMMTQPAEHLDDFPSLYPPEPYSSSPSSPSYNASPTALHRLQKLEVLRSIPRSDPTENELHLRKVIGVDIRGENLQAAKSVVEPPKVVESRASDSWSPRPQERWEDLTVQLYEGSLEVYNEALENIEAIVATEVIEHLTPIAFDKFPSTVLGLYGPRLLIVTTPNHEFNPYFVPSGKDDESLHRFPDPTGRTNRVFRDEDHTFEMTRAEFEEWATKAADDHDYDVTFSGCGSLAGYFNTSSASAIPSSPPSLASHPALAELPASLAVPEQPSTFFATQIATFRKIITNESERSPRSHRPAPLPFFSSPLTSPNIPLHGSPNSSPGLSHGSEQVNGKRPSFFTRQSTSPTPHKLFYSSHQPAHSSASVPAPLPIILRELKKVILESGDRDGTLTLRRAWNSDELRELCGGSIGNIVDAVLEEDDESAFAFERIEGKVGDEALKIGYLDYEGGVEGEEDRPADDAEEETPDQHDFGDIDEAIGQWDGEGSDGWGQSEYATPSGVTSAPQGWR